MKVRADRLNTVEEYYFSTKLKEVNSLIKKGNPIINFNGKTALVRTDLQATEFYMDVKKAKTTVWGFYDTHMVKDENWKITKHTLTSIGSE